MKHEKFETKFLKNMQARMGAIMVENARLATLAEEQADEIRLLRSEAAHNPTVATAASPPDKEVETA